MSRPTRTASWVLLAVAVAALGVVAYLWLWTTYMVYDDEGYVLYTLRAYSKYGHLYTHVYTQYGPFFCVLFRGLHAIGLPLVNTSARWLTLVCWLGTALLSAGIVLRATGALVASVAAMAGVFLHLYVMTSEPSHPGGLIVLFFVGSFLGVLVGQVSSRRGSALTLCLVVSGIALSLVLHGAGYANAAALLPLAAAAGAQNAVLQPIGAARLGTTFVTGTLFAAGQDLARATRGLVPPMRWLQHLMVWAALCLGALAGALGYERVQMAALLVPAAVYFGCLVWFAIREPR